MIERHSRAFAACLAVCSLACTKTDNARVVAHESASSTARLSQPAPVNAAQLSGPRIAADSTASAPFFKVEGGVLFLHIPTSMAAVISDSLPRFELIQRTAYEPALVQLADEQASDSREIGETPQDSLSRYALSAAIGDFDGDSTSDIVIMGNARDSTVTLFVLAQSRSRSRPQIIFITKPRPTDRFNRESQYLNTVHAGPVRVFDEDDKTPPFQLKTDAVQLAYFEKGAQVFFLDHGTVQSIITSD